MKVNTHTVSDVDTLRQLMIEKPYEIEPHGDRPHQVDILDIQFDVLVTFRDTDYQYVNEEIAEEDGVPIVQLTSVISKPTSVYTFDSNSIIVSVHNHKIDAYTIYEQLFSLLDVSVNKDGNDFVTNNKKLFGVSNFETDAWASGGQIGPRQLDPDRYFDLPDEKFEDKNSSTIKERVGNFNDYTDHTVTVSDVANGLSTLMDDI